MLVRSPRLSLLRRTKRKRDRCDQRARPTALLSPDEETTLRRIGFGTEGAGRRRPIKPGANSSRTVTCAGRRPVVPCSFSSGHPRLALFCRAPRGSLSICSTLVRCSRSAFSSAAWAAAMARSRRSPSIWQAFSSLPRWVSRRFCSFSKASAALRAALSSSAWGGGSRLFAAGLAAFCLTLPMARYPSEGRHLR
jgi:hypothetical protein